MWGGADGVAGIALTSGVVLVDWGASAPRGATAAPNPVTTYAGGTPQAGKRSPGVLEVRYFFNATYFLIEI